MQQCPDLFSPVNSGCVYDCTQNALFTLNTEGGQAKCVYTPDTTKVVTLNPLNAIPAVVSYEDGGNVVVSALPTLESLKVSDTARFTQYNNELTRVNSGIQLLLASIDRAKRIQDAFTALQKAEDTRRTDPQGYQLARNTYYTMTKGNDWIDVERERLLTDEIRPETDRYRSNYESVVSEKNGQQRTIDIINSVKDRLLSMKDDFQYTTTMFKSQLDKVKSQLNIERRGRQPETSSESTSIFYRWFNTLLNLVIAIVLVYAGLTIWTKISQRREQKWTTYTVTSAKA